MDRRLSRLIRLRPTSSLSRSAFARCCFRTPGAQIQLALDLQRPYANALRKAYLCHAPIKQLAPGSVVAFYESAPAQCVAVVGVVEETLRSGDPGEIVGFVSNRTVYTLDEVVAKCEHGEVLAILFRLDRVLPEPIPIEALVSNSVVRRAPQSVMSIAEEGARWIREQLPNG